MNFHVWLYFGLSCEIHLIFVHLDWFSFIAIHIMKGRHHISFPVFAFHLVSICSSTYTINTVNSWNHYIPRQFWSTVCHFRVCFLFPLFISFTSDILLFCTWRICIGNITKVVVFFWIQLLGWVRRLLRSWEFCWLVYIFCTRKVLMIGNWGC